MHIEKNVFDNVFNIVMDVKGKTKDTTKARMDIHEYCKRPELELLDIGNGKIIKPKAQYVLNLEQKRAICEWVSNLKLPDTYVSNLARCVDIREGKLFGMKSHDCHVFLECLLPIAFKALPEKVWSPLTELSQFFRDICSTTLREEQLILMEQNIALTLCKLERIFPPSFFDSMEHLPIHLAYEARVGGPVQYRWMYPFERFLNTLKRKVKNTARVEGSIAEAYITAEISTFGSHYFESHVYSSRTRVPRNDDGGEVLPPLSIFNHPGRPLGECSRRFLTDEEFIAASLYILLNYEEVMPYVQ